MIRVIGIGLDGLAGLTESVREIITQARVLVGSERHLAYIAASHPGKRLILGNIQTTLAEVRGLEAEEVVFLVSGDPLFFGLGRLLLQEFSPQQLQFYPHLSSIQLAFSRVKLPWQNAKIISVHGRSLDALIKPLQGGEETIAVLTDQVNSPSAIALLYQSLQLPIPYKFWVCENLGDPELERVQSFSPEELLDQIFANLNIVILSRQEQQIEPLDLKELPLLGIPDHLFLTFRDRPGLMTKREVRLSILGELALQPKQTVWDIGAGTGSVAIEIARLSPTSGVYGIEKTAMGHSLIEQNCQRFQVKNLKAVCGKAPEALANLPNPDRIFIGGSGGNLSTILAVCQERISDNGIIVLALATLEHLHLALEWLRKHSWHYKLLQLQISRSTPIAQLTRFTPLNPVTLITASRTQN